MAAAEILSEPACVLCKEKQFYIIYQVPTERWRKSIANKSVVEFIGMFNCQANIFYSAALT